MSTLILHHDDCLAHSPGSHHPESPQRYQAVLSGVSDIKGTQLLPAPLAGLNQVLLVHQQDYWQQLLDAEPIEGRVAVDPDTFLSQGSINAALRASGAACFAVDQVFAGKARNAFCATRPPGHHAEEALAMGFCLINHVAIAARHALATHPVNKVAILDFDVHHGNGTQAIFEQSPELLFVSSHQVPLYPGTGAADETGFGNILNLPLAANTGSREFRKAWTNEGLPALEAFEPDLMIISAGFDAHQKDPLAQLELQDEDFSWVTNAICELADQACDGRVISVLEGGYNLDALASASRAHVEALASRRV